MRKLMPALPLLGGVMTFIFSLNYPIFGVFVFAFGFQFGWIVTDNDWRKRAARAVKP